MIGFIVASLLVMAVANGQKTNAEVKVCMEAADSKCQAQCISQITDAKVQGCIRQGEGQKAQMKITMTTCLQQALPSLESMPCMAPPTGGPGFPGTEGKFGPGPMGSNFGRPQIPAALQEFHNCSAECMKNAMAPCFTGCSQTVDKSVMDAILKCHPKPPQSQGNPQLGQSPWARLQQNGNQPPAGQFDMLQCLNGKGSA